MTPFDKTAYQREYMRKRRAEYHEKEKISLQKAKKRLEESTLTFQKNYELAKKLGFGEKWLLENVSQQVKDIEVFLNKTADNPRLFKLVDSLIDMFVEMASSAKDKQTMIDVNKAIKDMVVDGQFKVFRNNLNKTALLYEDTKFALSLFHKAQSIACDSSLSDSEAREQIINFQFPPALPSYFFDDLKKLEKTKSKMEKNKK